MADPVAGFNYLPVGSYEEGQALAVSSDGTTTVGTLITRESGYLTQACYWIGIDGPFLIPTPPGDVYQDAFGVSSDGSIIAGSVDDGPYVWIRGSPTITQFGTSDDFVYGMSADGSTIVGGTYATGAPQACKWDRATLTRTLLGWLPGHNRSTAFSVSADGTYIVGDSGNISSSASFRAFRWSAVSGMVDLGVTSGYHGGVGFDCSDDGSVVVVSQAPDNTLDQNNTGRWTAATGTQLLPMLAGNDSPYMRTDVMAVSGDGTKIVGWSPYITPEGDVVHRACLAWWTSDGITVPVPFEDEYDVFDLYPNENGVSYDGRVIVGWKEHAPELPFLYFIPAEVAPATSVTVSELFFETAFIDLSVESNRRKFIAVSGTPAWMERDGSLPFAGPPAVYLTTLVLPLDFTQNNGDGGAFPFKAGV